MMNLLRTLTGLFLTLLIIGSSGCNVFRKINTTTTTIDTIYYPDTIKVEVVAPTQDSAVIIPQLSDSIIIVLDSLTRLVDSLSLDSANYIHYNDSISYIEFSTFMGGGTGISVISYMNDSDKYIYINDIVAWYRVYNEFKDMKMPGVYTPDTSRINSSYAYSIVYMGADLNLEHFIYDNDSIDVYLDSLIREIVTKDMTIIQTRQNSKKFRKYRRVAWLFGFILLVITIYALKPFVASLFNREK